MVEGSNLDRFFADVKTEVEAIDDFPDEIELPIIRQLGRTDFVASVAVTGPERMPDLKAYAEELKDRMLRWGGIPKIEIKGFSDHQIRIELRTRPCGSSVSRSPISPRRSAARAWTCRPAASSRRSAICWCALPMSASALMNFFDLVVVPAAQGGQIRLGDIATITDQFDLAETKVLFDGKPAALLEVTKTENEDTLEVIDAVNAFLEHERQVAPPGVRLVVTNDRSSIVRDRLQSAAEKRLAGAVSGVCHPVAVFRTALFVLGCRRPAGVVSGAPCSLWLRSAIPSTC